MNIIAIEDCPTSTKGGSERSYFDVLTGLKEGGHTVMLAYLTPGDLLEKYREAGINTMQIGAFMLRSGQKMRDMALLLRCIRKLAVYDKAVIYLNFTEALPLAAALKLFFGYKIVCHIRIGYFGLSRQLKFTGRATDQFIVNNKDSISVFENVFKKKGRVKLIYNGIGIPAKTPKLRERKANDFLRILYLGRIAPEKGISELVQAMSLLRNSGFRNFRLQITGSFTASYVGDFRSELETLVRQLDMNPFVEFSPPVENPIDYISKFDLFVFPSTWNEPFGRTIPEAILAGTTVLARDVGMVREIMADNPDFIFDTDESFRLKIIQFFHGQILFNFEDSKKRIVRDFNKTRMIKEIEQSLQLFTP